MQEVKIILTDDLDGGEAEDTITFVHDGYAYEIDLSQHNIDMFAKAMQPYVDAGRRVGKAKLPTAKKTTLAQARAAADPASTKASTRAASNGTKTLTAGQVPGHTAREVRDWARTQGLDVPDKGRIPAEVANQFKVAHPVG